MAKQPKHNKFLILDDVRVSYDPRQDSIMLTAGDAELKDRGGLKLDVAPGSRADGALRELLTEKGLIWKAWPKLESEELFARIFDPQGDHSKVLLGTDITGESVYWDTRRDPHLWIHRQSPGSGASIIQRALFYHCLSRDWDFYGIDLKKVELIEYADYPMISTEIATTVASVHRMLSRIEGLLDGRYRNLEALGLNDRSSLPEGHTMNRTMVLVDALEPLLEAMESPDFDKRTQAMDSVRVLKKIVRLGRPAGIHLSISGAYEESPLDSEIFNFLPIALGRLSPEDLPKHVRELYSPKRSNGVIGRASVLSHQGQIDFEIPYFPQELRDSSREVAAQGGALPAIADKALSSGFSNHLQPVVLKEMSPDRPIG
jgi:hypothetical protein